MFKKTKLCKGLLLAFGGSLALGALPARAQDAQATQLDRVEITGSSIKRLAAEAALPVQVIKAEDLAKAGVTNAEQALSFVAANQSSLNTSTSVGSSTGGASFADLRGLGASRTLVLVNGKRMVNNPYLAAAVDLNGLPFGAVERIEVLTDGASAIYGSDAIAGVINFITRKEYSGINASASGSWPGASGGGEQYTASLTGGYGNLADQKFNIFGGISYSKQNALPALSRDFAKTAYIPQRGVDKTSGTTFPANYWQGASDDFNPSLPNCAPPSSLPSSGICGFNYVAFIDIIPQQEQWSYIARGSYAVNKDNTISLEYLQANNTVSTVLSPTPLTGLSMQPGSPYYPVNPAIDPTQPISLSWRQTTVGGRASEFENKTDRWMLAWDGSYKGWDYNVTALQSKADVTNSFTGGYVNATMIRNGLNGLNGAPYLNPFGNQSAAGQDYLMSSRVLGQVQKADGTFKELTAVVSGEVAKLPAGPMMLAVGVDFFKDEADYTNNFALIRQAASSGLSLAEDSSGDRRDNAVYAELNVPIVKTLDMNLALRYDDYSDFGSTWNPKIALRWQPTQQVLVRGSYNTGFRAPTLYDVYSPNSITYTAGQYNDPLLCPNGVVDTANGGVKARDCGMQFQQQQGGNLKLKPETSKAWTIGLLVQPNQQWTLGLDYWNYKVEDSIGSIGESVIFGDTTKYAANFVRCGALTQAERDALADTCGGGASPNALAYIVNGTTNLGNYKTSGLDLQAAWQSAVSDWGQFSVNYRGTYVLTYEYQLEQGGEYFDNLGNYFNGGPVARYRQMLSFGWQKAAWSAALINRYTSSYYDQNETGDPQFDKNVVAGFNVWDLSVTWAGVKGLAITGGITNLFDRDPPFSNQQDNFQVGYDNRYANPIGRAFLLRATYNY
ncbi:MAG TPA: TonB-dependent receptor [Burkholderiaceae bacterium]|jgi:iron complex outermembrane receptor protein|nr:TonB-dependent receptor [Burkholderiaceae bacterium]